MEDQTFLFKVILIGNSGVGKTCLARRFIQGEFPVNKGATIGVDFMIKQLMVDGCRVNLQLWDTAGQERFRAITQSYYRSAHCLVLVYDISSQPSFDSLGQWCRDIDNYTTSHLDGTTSVLRVLVGNKSDKDKEIPIQVAEQFAKHYNFDLFMETSALLTDNSVQRLFTEIAKRLVQKRQMENRINNNANNSNNNSYQLNISPNNNESSGINNSLKGFFFSNDNNNNQPHADNTFKLIDMGQITRIRLNNNCCN